MGAGSLPENTNIFSGSFSWEEVLMSTLQRIHAPKPIMCNNLRQEEIHDNHEKSSTGILKSLVFNKTIPNSHQYV
jgi:hypothetical protein